MRRLRGRGVRGLRPAVAGGRGRRRACLRLPEDGVRAPQVPLRRPGPRHEDLVPEGVRRQDQAPALHPYQMVRLRECIWNKARLRELGLPCDEYDRVLTEGVAGHSDKNRSEDVHSNKYQSGDSESEYDPLQDDNGEGDLIDDDNAKTRMENKLSTTTEGAAQVVANVLAENTKKNQFLKNVGFQNVRPRSSEESTEIELEAEKRANAELRTQVADLSNKV